MKKDIQPPKVKGVAVAIVPEINNEGAQEWAVYVLNLKTNAITGVLVSSQGYGEIEGEMVKTSQLRHFLEDIDPGSFKKVEIIMENTFHLNNQYWVSFWEDGQMLDKKFIFLPDSIQEANLVKVPFLNAKGIIIK